MCFYKENIDFCVSKGIMYLWGHKREVMRMSPKMGRPTTDPKTHEMRIRMSDKDVQTLESCCEKSGMTKADVIRQGIRLFLESLK